MQSMQSMLRSRSSQSFKQSTLAKDRFVVDPAADKCLPSERRTCILLWLREDRFVRAEGVRGEAMCKHLITMIALAGACSVHVGARAEESNMRLASWERGVSVQPIDAPDMKVYLWFYEWNMFDAVEKGQHTRGAWTNRITVEQDGKLDTVTSSTPGITLAMTAVRDGAEMKLTIFNRTEHDWPSLASIRIAATCRRSFSARSPLTSEIERPKRCGYVVMTLYLRDGDFA